MFLKYVADNLAAFAYDKQEEALTVISVINRVISITATMIVRFVEELDEAQGKDSAEGEVADVPKSGFELRGKSLGVNLTTVFLSRLGRARVHGASLQGHGHAPCAAQVFAKPLQALARVSRPGYPARRFLTRTRASFRRSATYKPNEGARAQERPAVKDHKMPQAIDWSEMPMLEKTLDTVEKQLEQLHQVG
jgi:hypothetical protein